LIDCAEALVAASAATAPMTSGKYLIRLLHRFIGFDLLHHRGTRLPGTFAPARLADDTAGSARNRRAVPRKIPAPMIVPELLDRDVERNGSRELNPTGTKVAHGTHQRGHLLLQNRPLF